MFALQTALYTEQLLNKLGLVQHRLHLLHDAPLGLIRPGDGAAKLDPRPETLGQLGGARVGRLRRVEQGPQLGLAQLVDRPVVSRELPQPEQNFQSFHPLTIYYRATSLPVTEVAGYLAHVLLRLLGHVVVSSLLRPAPWPPSLGLGENSGAGARHGASEPQPGLQAAHQAASVFFLEVTNGVEELSVRVLRFLYVFLLFPGRLHRCGHGCRGSYRDLAITEINSRPRLSCFMDLFLTRQNPA